MTEVTWKNLAKTVTDKTKISEEIDSKIVTHNEDPSAHKQTGEALDVHRVAELLDHLNASVGPGKLNLNKIYIKPNFESLDAWSFLGGGGILLYLGGIRLSTPVGAAGFYEARSPSDILSLRWDTKDAVSENIVKFGSTANITSYWGVGHPATHFLGFKLDGGNLYACWVVNTIEYLDQITGIDVTVLHTYRVVLTHGEKIEFYIDEVLKKTETGNLPVSPDVLTLFYFKINHSQTGWRWLNVIGAFYWQDR